MKIYDNFKNKIKGVVRLLDKRYRGFPVGVLVGIAIVAGTSAYAAPMLLSSKPVSKTTDSSSSAQHLTQSNNPKQPNNTSNSTNTGTTTPTNQSGSTTSSNSKSSSSPTSSSSSSSSTNTPASNTPTKPTPTITGISVVTSSGGQTVTVNYPVCDFQSINSGTPETCYHYVPLPFSLVAKYSDGSTAPLSWSDATETSLSYDIPRLFSVDASNNTLLEGNGLQYYNYPMNSTVPMNITYQSWTYTEYINVIINSLWGS
ncbi:MAG TPA: hypothetical protein VMR34_05375 [Candidatus Saccharimonadales bacterium]|nr:hypothetical protein [Candidatus Saccharimonadales bacterium]